MELWIVRHAEAADTAAGEDDARRALTAQGRERFERGVRGLRHLGARFDRVLFSPLLRAQETADLLAPLCAGEMCVTAALAHESDERLLREIAGESVAVVGHEPWLSQLCAWLATGWRAYDEQGALLTLAKGGVAHLAGEPRPGSMTLVAVYPPRALRKLGRR